MTPRTSADELYENLTEDRFSYDPDAAADYGFDRCRSASDMRSLLEVYKTVVLHAGVGPATLDEWRRQGKRALGIKIGDALVGKAHKVHHDHLIWYFENPQVWDPEVEPDAPRQQPAARAEEEDRTTPRTEQRSPRDMGRDDRGTTLLARIFGWLMAPWSG